jgi:hypothetical protein
MPIYIYQLDYSAGFNGLVEADDPGKAVNKIKKIAALKKFFGHLFEVKGARIIPVPEAQFAAKVANGAQYYRTRRLVIARQRMKKLYDRRRRRLI